MSNETTKKTRSSKRKVIDLTDLNPQGLTFWNIWVKHPKKLAWMFISAVLFNIGIAFFLGKAATVASGVSAIIQSLTYTLDFLRNYFALLYLAINLPFMFFFWKKNSRIFMILTMYWLLFQVVSEFIFSGFSSSHPYVVRDWLNDKFSIYYLRNTVGGEADKIAWNVYSGTFINGQQDAFGNHVIGTWKHWTLMGGNIYQTPEGIKYIQSDALSSVDFSNNTLLVSQGQTGWHNFGKANPNFDISVETWPIIIYTIAGAILGGLAASIAWKNSGSTAGSDIIIYYISKVKKMSVGRVSFFVACLFAGISIIAIGGVELGGVVNDHPWNMAAFVVRVISTLVYISVYNILISFIYPKYKKIKIDIHTTKVEEVCAHFKEINYWHGYSVVTMKSGYTGKESTKIETIALFLEQSIIEQEVRKIDPNAWIGITPVVNVKGIFNTNKVD
ncbi:YitT family protein [[Mycoplasma] gypis]|uniref:YitT family protein n=1 Tax=[Mycoplasma] gypis TaxID=92404 RepID=A0ABZ2RSV6_9BACT|nr:YitT family protein [[Mycoplasma] gypis]MBN0919103.1 YitT family protein [[Mycoplasma] gypis]